jgi:hypothetical protein
MALQLAADELETAATTRLLTTHTQIGGTECAMARQCVCYEALGPDVLTLCLLQLKVRTDRSNVGMLTVGRHQEHWLFSPMSEGTVHVRRRRA